LDVRNHQRAVENKLLPQSRNQKNAGRRRKTRVEQQRKFVYWGEEIVGFLFWEVDF